MPESELTISIKDLAARIGKASITIRQWLNREDFPEHLRPGRQGGRQKLMWSEDQVEGLRAYAAERDAAKGSFGRTAAEA